MSRFKVDEVRTQLMADFDFSQEIADIYDKEMSRKHHNDVADVLTKEISELKSKLPEQIAAYYEQIRTLNYLKNRG